MKYCDYHTHNDKQYAYTCDDCMISDPIEPGDIAPDGTMYAVKDKAEAKRIGYGWFILEDGTTYQVATTEAIEANLTAPTLADMPF